MRPKRAYETLDGLRGVAAIVVVIWHCSKLFGFQPASGYLAVDLFFCISGFVVSKAYDDRLREPAYFPRFVVARLVRVYPFYLFSILVSSFLVMAALAFHLKTNWAPGELVEAASLSIFLLPSPPLHSVAVFPLNNPVWSLLVEIVGNIIYGAMRVRVELVALGAIIAAVVLVWLSLRFGTLDIGGSWPLFPLSLGRVIYSSFLGALLSRGKSYSKSLPSWMVVTVFTGLLFVNPVAFRSEYDLFAVLFVIPLLVFLAAGTEPLGHLATLYRVIAAASYGLYVLHVPVCAAVLAVLQKKTHGDALAPWSGWLVILVLVPVCAAADRLVDVPMRTFLRRSLRV